MVKRSDATVRVDTGNAPLAFARNGISLRGALMLSSLVLAQDGLAQDGLAQEEGPLAIPAQPGQPSTQAPSPHAPPPAPRSDRPGAMSPQKLEALRRDLDAGIEQARNGETVDGEDMFATFKRKYGS